MNIKHHSFSVEIAKIIGVEKAIILHNFAFWIEKNIANETNCHEGVTWTFNSANALCDIFPYWSKDKIKRMIKQLEDDGYLVSGNFNKVKFDRTKWYAIKNDFIKKTYGIEEKNIPLCGSTPSKSAEKPIVQNCTMDGAELNNGRDRSAPPIPDVNTNITKNINLKNIKKEKQTTSSRRRRRATSSNKSSEIKSKDELALEFQKKVLNIYPKSSVDAEGKRRLIEFFNKKIFTKEISENNFFVNLNAAIELQNDYMFALKNYVGISSRSKKYFEEDFIEKLKYKKSISNNNSRINPQKKYCQTAEAQIIEDANAATITFETEMENKDSSC